MGLALNLASVTTSAPAARAMPLPERVLHPPDDGQAALPLATAGVQRWVWHSRFGSMLIEVAGDEVFVNGQRVVPHVAGPSRGT